MDVVGPAQRGWLVQITLSKRRPGVRRSYPNPHRAMIRAKMAQLTNDYSRRPVIHRSGVYVNRTFVVLLNPVFDIGTVCDYVL